jgi:hypothetical protein
MCMPALAVSVPSAGLFSADSNSSTVNFKLKHVLLSARREARTPQTSCVVPKTYERVKQISP